MTQSGSRVDCSSRSRASRGCPTPLLPELVELGVVHELNRQFLHPLGLALQHDGGHLTGFQDHRDDPEGMTFVEVDAAKVHRFASFSQERCAGRQALEFIMQPTTSIQATMAEKAKKALSETWAEVVDP